MVSPLRYGAGIKGKIGRCLGYGVPCVATGISVEGMHLTNGENVIIGHGEVHFADMVYELYHNAKLWNKIAHNGLKYFEKNYSLDAGRAKIRNIIQTELGDNKTGKI